MSAEPVSASNDGANAPAHEGITQEPGFKVFAGNLAYATTDEGLKNFFAPVADDIISTHIITRGLRSAGYGFVTVKSEAAVEKAVVELNRKELDGRTVIVEAAKPVEDKDRERSERKPKKRSGRRGSKAPLGEVTEAEANGEAGEKPVDAPAESAEGAEGAEKPKKKHRKHRKSHRKPKAANGDAAPPATENQGAAPDVADGETPVATEKGDKPKKPRRVRRPRPPRPEGEAPSGEPSKSVLFVANLAFDIDDSALAKIFTDEGISVASARVVMRRLGHPRRSKGYGFVDVENEENQKRAVELLSGKLINDREIAVKVAISNPPDAAEHAAEGAPANYQEETVAA
ncbi:uncharacterized protein EI90DRAFT_3291258 [Cantharellus anzutake]|uniref:uncharacterized protein n=1 Tax=Cantharellus anzutake TaxID=1750568 RepID=UPI00190856EC|nr:uncharacterized protein EI90DRAFT_3291258 [Cantharellus anzutake]KAF8326524.1 hypothetical protein EI90DRAFT_3291258 [Cantharellus anzutake]